ncbi:MAG: hypothetical protein M1812_004679 [Candelaria pacifica]|nr:MAG: hypothetical protein M1812_004679 [Candelaria pacifica]
MASGSGTAVDAPGTLVEHFTPTLRQEDARGGRRGDRGGRQRLTQADGPQLGRKGGRGGRGGAARGNSGQAPNGEGSARIPPPHKSGNQSSFGPAMARFAPESEAEVKGSPAVDGEGSTAEEHEAELCFICASPVVHNSLAPCNHRTCHICALRLRALYKTKACAHCRSNAEYVIFTDDASKRYEDFSEADFGRSDDTLGIKYEKAEIFEDTVLLLRYNCPEPSCDIACLGWPDLHRHVKSTHGKIMCDSCTKNKKVFTHEHELFTIGELRRHEKFGDDNPGAVDQSGFKGHPECGFCRKRFYGDDELYVHCREQHERCHICDRRNQGRQQQYFVDYNSLELHFRKDHFLCAEQDCLDKKFVVFESEIDLKAHQLHEHPNGLSKDARRDARTVDISGFDYRIPYQPDNRGGRREREGRGRGRGRDPNTEAIPQSTAQPLRRDELAYQRQMAIQSAQSVSTRTFGGQLTSSEASNARLNPRFTEPASISAPRPMVQSNDGEPSLESLSIEGDAAPSGLRLPPSPGPPHAMTPEEQTRRLRHNAVIERASNMLKNDQLKLSEFRTKTSSFRTSTISASELIDAFFSIFDTTAAELGKLIKELAYIFEIESKRNDLLKAWNDWRAINEDYPILPGPSGILPGASASVLNGGGGGRRVLKLKSSTAQSSRSAVSRHGSWGNAASSSPFPTMQSGAAVSANRVGNGRVGATPWATPTVSTRSSPAPSRPQIKPPPPKTTTTSTSSDAFPALPAAAKPTSSIFGYGSGILRRDNGRSTPVNAWSNGGSASANPSAAAASENEAEPDEPAAGKKKGNKNKKQLLYHFG